MARRVFKHTATFSYYSIIIRATLLLIGYAPILTRCNFFNTPMPPEICDKAATGQCVERHLQIINWSGTRVDIFAVHRKNKQDLLKMTSINNGDTYTVGADIGDEFEIHELPASGICNTTITEEQTTTTTTTTCRRALIKLSDANDQVIIIDKDFSASLEENPTQAQNGTNSYYEIVQECQTKLGLDGDFNKLSNNNKSEEEISKLIRKFEACVHGGFATAIEIFNEEINFQDGLLKHMSNMLERFTCHDNDLETTPEPFAIEEWVHNKESMPRKVHIMHRQPASEIHIIENFISPVECAAVETQAEKNGLRNATVGSTKNSHVSENRKALQNAVTVKWKQEEFGDPITKVSRRIFDYANHVLDLNITVFGQEPLISIQYTGRGFNDTTPDQYKPHCDSKCQGLPHQKGSRVATIVAYCTLPENGGGHTNFGNAGVHIKPKVGNAIFFSYIDPEKKMKDFGFTKHSGCPVYDGQKKIVTQWIRLGVDKEHPWKSFGNN